MISTPFNWSSLISQVADETFGIPQDVTFQIVEDDQIKEVKAHKIILGMVSPMFKKMFFTTDVGDKTAKEIEIKETTHEALQIMIDAVYGTKSIEDSLKGKSVHDVFHVVNLLERYQIAEFQEVIEMHISNYPVTDETVLDVAAEALQYTRPFQKESQSLLLTCAKFLKPKLKDAYSILKYASENENHKDVVSTLLAKIYQICEAPEIICPNCNYNKENCHNGMEIKEDDFREGIVVTNNKANNAVWSNCNAGTAKVTKVTGTQVTVSTIKPGVAQNRRNAIEYSNGNCYDKVYNGINFFAFSCD